MTNSIKKKTSNVVVWIIMLLLVAGLGGFGVSNFGGQTAAIATVGDTEVDINAYYRALQQELRQFQAQTGQPIPLSQAVALGIDRNVRARLITAASLDNETKRIGLSVGDERVKAEILASPDFRGLDGKFDRTSYRELLNRSGMSEAEYEDSIRTETARTILQGAIINGTSAPKVMTDAFLDYTRQQRNFSWLRLDQNNLTELVPEPSDEQLDSYYQANAARFTEPEKKRLSYIWVTPDMIVDQIEISQEDLQKEYDKRASEYSKPERRLVERLVFPNAEDATAAKQQLDAGETSFEVLVIQRGLELLDVDLGDVTIEDLGAAGETVFAMETPGVIGPVDTDLGPALYRMNGIIAAQNTTFKEARQSLQDEMALDRARRQIAASITEVDDLLAGGATLQEVADETNLQLAQIDWAEGDSAGIASYSAFREAASEVNAGDYAEAKELDDGGIFALEFVETIAPALKPIDSVMSEVISGWETEEIENRLTAMATDLLARLEAGEDMSSLGYPVTTEQNILRDASIEGLPFGLINDVFEMDKGAAKIVDGSGVVFVVRLDDILAPDASSPDLTDVKSGIETAISQALSQDIFAAFTSSLQSEAGVTVNTAAVNAVHSQFPQ